MVSNWRAYTQYSHSISRLLGALKLDDALADFIITEKGVKIQTTSISRSFNGHLFLPKQLFTTYEFEPNGSSELSTTLSLPAVVSSLKMAIEWQSSDESSSGGLAKSNVGCLFVYLENNPLQISFAQGSMQTACDLTTYAREDSYDSERIVLLDLADIRLQVIMASDALTSMLNDLELVNTQTMMMNALERPTRLSVKGIGLDASIDYVLPADMANSIETMVAEPGTRFSYDFTNFSKCREIARIATRASIRCDGNGTLSIQFQCEFESNSCYVEFCFLANV